MPRVYISQEEWYPVLEINDEPLQWMIDQGLTVEMPQDLLDRYRAVEDAFKKMQDEIRALDPTLNPK